VSWLFMSRFVVRLQRACSGSPEAQSNMAREAALSILFLR
jgi:hypothetical protein